MKAWWLFKSLKEEFYAKLRSVLEKHFDRLRTLYSAYQKEMKKVYSDITEEKLKELYVLHSILSAVATCLVNSALSSSERLMPVKGFSLPFLHWWQELLEEEPEVQKFTRQVIYAVEKFNWIEKKKSEDIFRLLYEEYISKENRKKLGEYYTPAWLVRWCLDQSDGWQDLKVLDPCCGTGAFLDEVLRRKIKSGKSPDDAILEVIGFDVNPLAVVLARAELFLTYRAFGGKGQVVPSVFCQDGVFWTLQLSLWDGGKCVNLSTRLSLKELVRESFVATNPPWLVLTRIKGTYGQAIRELAKDFGAVGQEITGGDLASVFLCRYCNQAKASVFVMPALAATSGMSLKCLKDKPHVIYLFEQDVFGHGVQAAVVVVGRGQGEAYKVSKALDVKPTSASNHTFNTALDISKVANKVRVNGAYIMWLKGSSEKGVGIVVKEYDQNTGKGKLINMEREVFLGFDFKERWLRKVIYMDRVLPFKLLKPYDAVISDKGESALKDFLKALAGKASSRKDQELLCKLADEVKQGKPEYLSKDRFYMLHRVNRIFSSVVFKPDQDNLYVVHKTLCFVEFSEKFPAYYYCGIVNYLIEKLQKGFHRHSHGRVLKALDFLGVHWQDLDWQLQCAELSTVLHQRMEKIHVSDNKSALKVLRRMQEYWNLVELIDKHIDRSGIERAIRLLSEA